MRLMSFFYTVAQFKDGSKDVTRRYGWRHLEAGDRLMAVEKSQGRHRGESLVHMGEIEVVSVWRGPLRLSMDVHPGDPAREGYPDLSDDEFVDMFWRLAKCTPHTTITRIEFKKVRR